MHPVTWPRSRWRLPLALRPIVSNDLLSVRALTPVTRFSSRTREIRGGIADQETASSVIAEPWKHTFPPHTFQELLVYATEMMIYDKGDRSKLGAVLSINRVYTSVVVLSGCTHHGVLSLGHSTGLSASSHLPRIFIALRRAAVAL